MSLSKAAGARLDWERWGARVSDWVPYVTLVGAVVATLVAGVDEADRPIGFILVPVALLWVYTAYTRMPTPRSEQPAKMAVYFGGFLLLAALLMDRYPLFFIFAITGFFHAALLRPSWLAVTGVALTSILINTIITGFPWPTVDLWLLFGSIIVIQTVGIGIGTVVSEKLEALSEQRRQAVAELETALEENAGLHAQLLAQAREAGILDERDRLAREIHDTIAQGLAGIVTQLEAAEQAEDRPADRQRHSSQAMRLARESLSESRRALEATRPAQLDGRDLPAALREVVEAWSSLHDLPVELTTTGEVLPLHPEIEDALLRIAQEALANVARHARATRARLTLSYMGDVVTLDIHDDGVGFVVPDPAARRGSAFGLAAMRQRASRVAGSLAVESEPGGGTAVSARVPAVVPPGLGTAASRPAAAT